MFIVSLEYIRPLAEIEAALPEHTSPIWNGITARGRFCYRGANSRARAA